MQLPSGELPYALGKTPDKDKTHFLCFQYNAFEFIDLVHYHKNHGRPGNLARHRATGNYLATGLTDQGKARFDCLHETPDVPYYTIAIARALSVATDLGLGNFRSQAEQGFQQVCPKQRADGSFNYHSRQNYGCLTDRRSYPRYLSMIFTTCCRKTQVNKVPTESKLTDTWFMAKPLKVAYILHRFPYLTETFIMREVSWLRSKVLMSRYFRCCAANSGGS